MAKLSFGMKLKRLREKRGLTQNALAKKAGLHLTTIGKMEAGMRGNPKSDTLRNLAKALGVQIAKLLD